LDDYVPEVDADAQFDTAVRSDTRVLLGHRLLHFDRAAHRIASTTLATSTSMPSPVVLTMRPCCSLIFGSRSSRRSALRRSSVPSSSATISREYPAPSAARIAAR